MRTFLKQNRRKKMKKVLLALILVATSFFAFGQGLFAADEESGDLVVHFIKWDGDYSEVGLNSWGHANMPGLKNPDEIVWDTDDFGVYFTVENLPAGIDGTVGVQFVGFNNSGTDEEPVWSPDWNNKKYANHEIPFTEVIANETVHIYFFEGGASRELSDESKTAEYIVSDPETMNMLVVYYNPTGKYEENLGIYYWDWNQASPEWNSPADVFKTVGFSTAGYAVKAFMISDPMLNDDNITPKGGLLIYYGDGDGSKKTGDVKISETSAAVAGDVGLAFVVGRADGYTAGENVYYDNPQGFREEAFTFKLLSFNPEEQSGTYAVDKNTIIVSTSANVTNPYPTAINKEEAEAMVESWFEVKEITGEGTWGEPLAIERVDFARNNASLNAFVVVLENDLDNTKDYEVFFKTNFPVSPEPLEVAVDVDVTINVTVPANTPAESVIRVAGDMMADQWNPLNEAHTAVQVGDTNVYSITFTVSVTAAFTTFNYKWTRGSWDSEEFVASDRALIIPNNVESITFDDVVEAWNDVDAPAEKYPAPVRVAPTFEINVEASLVIDMDLAAPTIVFIAPSSIIGKVAAERIINVAWGQPFNANQFPRYSAEDDRDGEITAFVYVPKGAFSVLDTRTEGDYTIMLRVVDTWGNVTEETFIFRVTKTA
jgi:hypothetical protein